MAAGTGGASQSRGKEKPATSQLMEAGGLEERMLAAFWGPPHAGYTPHGCVSHSIWNPGRERYSLFYGRNMLCLKLPFGEKLGGDSPFKEQPLLGHLHQDEPHQLPHVQPADHLLKPAGEGSSSHPRVHRQHQEAEPSCTPAPAQVKSSFLQLLN